ncbi:MAG: DUF3368 domain-containing protein [archaeon]|nr:DUF3368 domain-containing protein [archaeon]MCP8313544.1 DUF3368 domain-containing protein [archaeon]
MKIIVLNSTPLIYLAKIGLSHLLIDLRLEKITSPLVKQEVVNRGRAIGAPEATVIENLFQKHIIKVAEPRDQELISRLLEVKGLHEADIHVLALAKEYDGIAIVDDKLARKTAKIYKIRYAGTSYLLIRTYLQGLITKKQVKKAVDEMISAGWRCGVEDYQKIIQHLETLQREGEGIG